MSNSSVGSKRKGRTNPRRMPGWPTYRSDSKRMGTIVAPARATGTMHHAFGRVVSLMKTDHCKTRVVRACNRLSLVRVKEPRCALRQPRHGLDVWVLREWCNSPSPCELCQECKYRDVKCITQCWCHERFSGSSRRACRCLMIVRGRPNSNAHAVLETDALTAEHITANTRCCWRTCASL